MFAGSNSPARDRNNCRTNCVRLLVRSTFPRLHDALEPLLHTPHWRGGNCICSSDLYGELLGFWPCFHVSCIPCTPPPRMTRSRWSSCVCSRRFSCVSHTSCFEGQDGYRAGAAQGRLQRPWDNWRTHSQVITELVDRDRSEFAAGFGMSTGRGRDSRSSVRFVCHSSGSISMLALASQVSVMFCQNQGVSLRNPVWD